MLESIVDYDNVLTSPPQESRLLKPPRLPSGSHRHPPGHYDEMRRLFGGICEAAIDRLTRSRFADFPDMSTSVDLMALVNAVGLRLADGWIVMKHRRQLENASPASSGSRQEQTEASASLTSKRDAPWKSAMRSLEKKKVYS